MITKYFRKEPTKDKLLKNPNYHFAHKELAKKKDVVVYTSLEDAENFKDEGRWMWYYKSKPRSNRKTIIFNCVKCNIIWLSTI